MASPDDEFAARSDALDARDCDLSRRYEEYERSRRKLRDERAAFRKKQREFDATIRGLDARETACREYDERQTRLDRALRTFDAETARRRKDADDERRVLDERKATIERDIAERLRLCETHQAKLDRTLVELSTETSRLEAVRDEIREREAGVTARERAFAHLQKRPSGERVLLNVGGRRFETTVETLVTKAGAYFEALFADRWRRSNVGGAVERFLDRDPDAFAWFLAAVRTDGASLALLSAAQRECVAGEARYFCNDDVLERIKV